MEQGWRGGNHPENKRDAEAVELPSSSLSLVLIGPDEGRRFLAAEAFASTGMIQERESLPYPTNLDDVPLLAARGFDIIAVDLDADREFALELVARLSAQSQGSIMVYTGQADAELMVRCMWAGAREFLTLPADPAAMPETVQRAAARRPTARAVQKAPGKVLVFTGAKGGSGVTTLAANFAARLAEESSQSTLLIDLDLPLGDAAISMGLRPEHSTVSALQDSLRLDATLLSSLIVKHESGLAVLAAPGQYVQMDFSADAVEKLLAVARQSFDYVVIDAGSRPDLRTAGLFEEAAAIYLVVQVGIAELRNANRIVQRFFQAAGPRLQVVLNQYPGSVFGIDDDQVAKALTRSVQWKIPNDSSTMQKLRNNSMLLAPEPSSLFRAIDKMARNACGAPPETKKKGWFSRR